MHSKWKAVERELEIPKLWITSNTHGHHPAYISLFQLRLCFLTTLTTMQALTNYFHTLHHLHHSRTGKFIATPSFIFITLNENAYCRARSNSRTQEHIKTIYTSPGVHGAQWLEHRATDDTEVVGSIPSLNSEGLFSSFFIRCRATQPSLTHRCIERYSIWKMHLS